MSKKYVKKIISVILSTCMAVTLIPANIPLRAMAAEETTVPEADKEEGEIPVAPGTDKSGNKDIQENNIITGVTISDTYYSINGKFPIYVEYNLSSSDVVRENLQLTVTNNEEKVAEGVSNSDENYFYIEECNGVKAGDKLKLNFSITEKNTNKVIWQDTQMISFVDMDAEINLPYIPTDIAENIEVEIGFLSQPGIDDDRYSVYLFDDNNEIAAATAKDKDEIIRVTEEDRYQDKFTINNPDSLSNVKWFCDSFYLYRTRELKTGEKLYLGYRYIKDDYIKTEKNLTVTVTDNPFIDYLQFLEGREYIDTGKNAEIIIVGGINIDYSKLSFVLRDENTGEIAGRSGSYVKVDRSSAYYCMHWENGKKPVDSTKYKVEFNYSDSEVNVKRDVIYDSAMEDSSNIYNYKTKSIEYYNREIPAGSVVSYELKEDRFGADSPIIVSGAGINVSSNSLLTVGLGDISPIEYRYILNVTYTTANGDKKTVEEIINTDRLEKPWLGLSTFENEYYLSDNESFEFSAGLYCNDESKLLDVCNAEIKKYSDSDFESKTLKLALKKENGKLSYSGIYQDKLEAGQYRLLFSPDGKTDFSYTFYVCDSNKFSLRRQDNNSIRSGMISMEFPSSEIADWYCGTDNSKIQNKLMVKVLDIRKQEIGTYNVTNGDFIVTGNTEYRTIQFSDKIKQEFSNIYYCYIQLYYDGVIVFNSNIPEESLYDDYYYSYDRYVYKDRRSISMVTKEGKKVFYHHADIGNYQHDFKTVSGTDSSFPVKITVADWHSIEPIKTFTVNKPGDIFTKSQLEGLSLDKVYNFFLEGADGSASRAKGYLADAEEDKPESVPTPTATPTPAPTSKPPVVTDSNAYIPGPSVQPTVVPTVAPTAAPTVQPTVAPTAVPTVQPTVAPTTVPTIQPTTTPTAVPTVQPTVVPTVAPEQFNTPEEKGKLNLKKNKITLTKGQKVKIKITSELNTNVTYKSLKPSVATVNKDGVVTAKKAGTAIITVKANGQVKKVKVTVKGIKKVEKNSSVKLNKNFKLSKKSVTIKKGKKFTIHIASGLSGKITFRSLDKKIASVSAKGVVKAEKKGKTTILIKRGKKTIKLKVTVNK